MILLSRSDLLKLSALSVLPINLVCSLARAAVSPPKKRILVVDSDVDVHDAARNLLSDAGYSVEIADTAEAGIEQAKANHFDAFLIDNFLSDSAGYDLFVELRRITPNSPVLLMTRFAFAPTKSAFKFRRDGGDFLLFKPFRKQWLLDALERLV